MKTDFLAADALFETVRDLCAIGIRRPATPQDSQAQNYLFDRFKTLGLQNVHKMPVHFHLWDPKERGLTVHLDEGDIHLDGEWLHLSAFTDANGVRAELVDVGKGGPTAFAQLDVRDKIVLVDITYEIFPYTQLAMLGFFAYDPDKSLTNASQPATWLTNSIEQNIKLAEENQALGIVLVSPFAMRSFIYYPEADPMSGSFGSLPGLVLTRMEGKRLRQAIKQRKVTATLLQSGMVREAVTYNIIGELPGRTDEVILVSSHHDSMWEGATEDAAGCAAVLGLAGYFSQFPTETRKRTLVFNLDAAEQIRVLGARAFIEQHRDNLLKRMLVDVHIEHIAWEVYEDEDGQIHKTGQLQARGLFVANDSRFRSLTKAMVEKHDLRRTVILPTDTPLGVPTDATSFNEAGYPVISFISAPIYWNTDADTLDKVPLSELERVTRAFADLIQGLDQI
jgi:hypothetical protein